jgi:hypothetical protein
MGSIQIEMRRKRNPNPNPTDVGVLPRRHVGSAVLDLHDGLREGTGPPRIRRRLSGRRRVGSDHHKRAPP